MIRVGITGQTGFVGTHLFDYLGLDTDHFSLVPFEDAYFEDPAVLLDWVSKCDAIVHLAALNRHNDPDEIYKTNVRLVSDLIAALETSGSKAHVLFSSSTQELFDNPYGQSKKEGRELLLQWAEQSGGKCTGLVIPNVFGPFGNPFYNSVVATFCHLLSRGEEPTLQDDKFLKLIYVGELVRVFRDCILNKKTNAEYEVSHTSDIKVSEILELLKRYKAGYADKGVNRRIRRITQCQSGDISCL